MRRVSGDSSAYIERADLFRSMRLSNLVLLNADSAFGG